MGVVYGWVAAGPRARSRSLPIHQADDCPTAAGPPGAGFEDVDHRPENKAGFFANNSQHENSVRSPYRTDVVREERLASMLAYILYENCGVPDSAPARLHARVSESTPPGVPARSVFRACPQRVVDWLAILRTRAPASRDAVRPFVLLSPSFVVVVVGQWR